MEHTQLSLHLQQSTVTGNDNSNQTFAQVQFYYPINENLFISPKKPPHIRRLLGLPTKAITHK